MTNFEVSGNPRLPFFGRSFTTMHAAAEPALNQQPSPLERGGSIKRPYRSIEFLKGKVGKLRSLFESPKSLPRADDEPPQLPPSKLRPAKSFSASFSKGSLIRLPGTEDRIVVFFTSLRGIRRTFEDCYAVRMIFKGFRVAVDERDVSMDLAFRKELQSVLGEKNVSLPQVFIRGNYVGGADVIKQMYETGELAQILSGFPRRAPGFICGSCGDVRFVPCLNCSGSRKIFDEDKGILERCMECNENGLVRCPGCC